MPTSSIASRAADVARYLEELSSSNEADRTRAARNLAESGDERAYSMIVKRLTLEKSERVLAGLLRAAGACGGEASIPWIAQYLAHDDPRIRANAAEALGMAGEESSGSSILPLLEDDNPRVKLNAAMALIKLGNREGLAALRRFAVDNDYLVRDAAMNIIAVNIRKLLEEPEQYPLPELKAILNNMADEDKSDLLRENACRFLYKLKNGLMD